MKIKNAFLTLFLGSGFLSNAQFTNTKVAELEKFKNEGTLVVAISDDETTVKATEEIMTSYWTASKFKVIRNSDLEAYVKANPSNYILTYVVNNTPHVFYMSETQMASKATPSTRTRTAIIGDGLMLSKNVKKINKLKPTDAMIYCFIDPDMELVDQKAEFIRQLGCMNAILTKPDLKDNQIGGWKVPTFNNKAVTSKELWISDTDLKIGADDAKMTAAYRPFKYKVVSKEEIAKAIIEKRKDIVYLARAEYQANAFMFVVHSPEDNKALFFAGGTAGFDAKALENIKNNKAYGQ